SPGPAVAGQSQRQPGRARFDGCPPLAGESRPDDRARQPEVIGRRYSHMDKGKVAEILVEIGTLLELQGENPFKTRAYSNAARALDALNEPLTVLIQEERLGDIPGIGAAIEKK